MMRNGTKQGIIIALMVLLCCMLLALPTVASAAIQQDMWGQYIQNGYITYRLNNNSNKDLTPYVT